MLTPAVRAGGDEKGEERNEKREKVGGYVGESRGRCSHLQYGLRVL